MSEMIKYEWKKIWKSRLAQLVIIGCGLFLVFCVWASIMQISATNEKGENFSGMSAVEVMKNTQKKIELTQENVNDIVGRYLKYIQILVQIQKAKHIITCQKKYIERFIFRTESY